MPLRYLAFIVVIAFLAFPAFAISDLADALSALRTGTRADRLQASYWLSHHLPFLDAVRAISGEPEVAGIEALLAGDLAKLDTHARASDDRLFSIQARLGAAKLLAQARAAGTRIELSAEDLAELIVLYTRWLRVCGSSDTSPGSLPLLLHSLRARSPEAIRFLKEVAFDDRVDLLSRLDALSSLISADADREGDVCRALGRCVIAAARTEHRVRALALLETALPRIREGRLVDDEVISLAILILGQARELVPTTHEVCHRLLGVRISQR